MFSLSRQAIGAGENKNPGDDDRLPFLRKRTYREESEELQMKTGKRLLAMLLVLAMLVSNLPVGAIAAEFEDLAAEPTEALTETEQPTEASAEETEAPETTAAPTETEERQNVVPEQTQPDVVTANAVAADASDSTVRFNFYVFLGTMDGAVPGKHWYDGQEDVMVMSMDVPVGTTVDMSQYVPYCYDYTFRGWFMDPNATEESTEIFEVTEEHLAANEEQEANGLYGLHFTAGWTPPADAERTMVYFDNTSSAWETVACVGLTASGDAHNITISVRETANLYYVPLPDEIERVYFQNASFLRGETPTAVTETFDVAAETVYTYTEKTEAPYLSFSTVYHGENGLAVNANENHTELVNAWGSVTLAVFWLNEYDADSGKWNRTPVEVTAGDGSIAVTRVEEATDCADFFYEIRTNVADQTSSVVHTLDDGTEVTMKVGTWPHHFHFTTDPDDSKGLIYDLDLDHLDENQSVDVYAVMFHDDFTWSNVRLSEDSQRFASLYQVSDSVYRISISGVARKHVMDNGYVNLEVLSTQTDKAGNVNDRGYMYLPIFMTPETSLIMVGVGDEGYNTGYYEDPDFISYQMRICPGQSCHFIFYLREWDAEAGEVRISDPVDPKLLKSTGYLTFQAIDPARIREGEANGQYFTRVTTDTFNQDDVEVYIELDDGTRIGGVHFYTDRHFVAFYNSEEMSDATFLGEYAVNPDGDSVLYVGFDDADCGGKHRGVPSLDQDFGTVETTDTDGVYKITLHEDVVNRVRRGEFQWLYAIFDVDYTDGSYAEHGAGIWLTARDEHIVPYVSYSWAQWDNENYCYFENDEDQGTGYTICPNDIFNHIYYLNTWDAELGAYVSEPVPVEKLLCADGNYVIENTPADQIREGEPNAACFASITAEDWGEASEITVEGVDAAGVYIATDLPQLGFYSKPEITKDSYILDRQYVVTESAEEYAFYVGLYADYWIIDENAEITLSENVAGLLNAEKYSDTMIKVTLTNQGFEEVKTGVELWPNICFKIRNTVDDRTDTMDAGGFCVRADNTMITPDEMGLYFRFLENWGEGFFEPNDEYCYGTNMAKGDVYSMYFFMRVWDEEQAQYVEIPVHPSYPQGINMERIEDVKNGEANGEYYYFVSVTEFDTIKDIWVEYAGETYTMPIFSFFHEFDVYSTQVPSHDTRILGPVDVKPFEENAVYFIYFSEDWTVTNAYLPDWCSELADVEEVEDDVWKVTLTQAGIDRNMTQWHMDIALGLDLQNNQDPGWTDYREAGVTYSRENLDVHAFFRTENGDYEVVDGGYIHTWPTGEYDSDEEGNTWEIWEGEALKELDGLRYDYTTNTLTMENYSGEWMDFEYECRDWETGETWYNLPSDTLTIKLIGDNSLITENNHAFRANGGLNVVITGSGSLYAETINNDGQDEEGNAQTFETWVMNGGNLTIAGEAQVTLEIAGYGEEACWDENDNKIGERAASMCALNMQTGSLYLKDNAYLETVIPDGMGRNGSVDVGEENAIWGERFPGGAQGIVGFSLLSVSGGTLKTQTIYCDWGMHENGSIWNGHYVQTGGDVIIQTTGSNHVLEDGQQHAHYEGFVVLQGSTANISGGTMTVNTDVTDEHMGISHWCEPITLRGGWLNISGTAEVTVTANTENCNLVYVTNEEGRVGRLNITGGTLNVSGSSGEGNGRSSIYLDHETEFTMTGGTINAWYADFMNHGPAHISGGTINIGGQYLYEDPEMAWITNFHAGGPEFIIDGGCINVEDGHFVAGGMVTMNGGTIDITNGSLEVGAGFAFNDGEINISNENTELTAEDHYWASVWIGNYMSIGGSDLENANPTLTIDHNIWTSAVIVAGTYHQMGGTVDVTHYGEVIDGVQNNAIYVKTEFDEEGNPVIATDEEGNPILNEEGNEVFVSGTFLMNDGVLNVRNAGDYEADLIIGMQADPFTFVQFLDGTSTFTTAQVHWDGEAHIGGEATIELKDAVLITNHGHLYMDGGMLKANDESAVCLGMSEMDGGRMELNNAQMIVRGGFHFNNGEILIDNTAADIDPVAIWTSLSVDTYFAIGNPEDPGSNPKLTINHNLERNEAVQLLGTLHLMAGTVDINVPVTRAPAIHINGIVIDEYTGKPFRVDEDGNPIGGEILQNGGVLNINALEEAGIAGIIAEEASTFFMNGGEANLNGTNLVTSGRTFLYGDGVLNINDGVLQMYETATMELDHGALNLTTRKAITEDREAAFQADPGSEILLKNGALTVDNEAYLTAMRMNGKLELDGSAQLNIRNCGTEQMYTEDGEWIWRFGLYAEEDSEILVRSGAVNVDTTDINGAFVTWGDFTQSGGEMNLSVIDTSDTHQGENAFEGNGMTLISGGVMKLVSTDTGFSNNSIEEVTGSRVNITGGTVNIEVPRIGMFLCSSTTISGGEVNIGLSNYYEEIYDGDAYVGLQRYTQGIFMYGVDNPDAVLNITGGKVNIEIAEPDQTCDFTDVQAIVAAMASADITGGVVRTSGGPVVFNSMDPDDHLNFGDMVVYSRNTGVHLEQLNYVIENPDGSVYISSFEEDNVPDDLSASTEWKWANDLVIVSGKAGSNVTWELKEGVLTFQTVGSTGSMDQYSAEEPAPWYWLSELITVLKIDSTLRNIGSYAMSGLTRLSTVEFYGNAPSIGSNAFAGVTATAYYPSDVEGWTASVKKSYGGNIKWLPRGEETVEVVGIWTEKDCLIAGEKTTLNAELYPDKAAKVIWKLRDGDENFATLTVRNNVATVTAKQITEKQVIGVYASAEGGKTQPMEAMLTLYPKAQSVSIFWNDQDVTNGKIKADVKDRLTLTASLNPNDAEEYLESAVTWTTSSKLIAEVDENGVVTFLKPGTVRITATAADGSNKRAIVTITVIDMIEDIELDENSVTELVGGKFASFVAYDENGKRLTAAQAVWSMDAKYEPYASITTAGRLTTKVVQEAVQVVVQVTSVDDPTVYEIHPVTVYPAAVAMQIEMDGANVTGGTIPVSIDGYDADMPPVVNLSAISYPGDALTDVTWKTSSKAIATVDENGTVSGTCKAGIVTITATDANSRKSVSVKLDFGIFADIVTITSPEKEIVSGQRLTLTAETFPEKPSKPGIIWSLKDANDRNYLSVTAAGVVQAKTVYAPTEVTVVANSKDGYAREELTLTVRPKDESILVITSGEEYLTNTTKNLNFNTDKTIALTARTLGTDAEETVTWTSSSKLIAEVDANGTVTFKKAGTVRITAVHKDGRKAVVTLKAAALATGITITDKTTGASEGLTLAAAKSMNLAVTGEGVTRVTVTWSVEPSNIATITSAGRLTASASLAYEQIVTVTARANDGSGKVDTVDVVLRPQVQGIQIHGLDGELTNTTKTHDMADGNIQLSAVVFPAMATPGVTWTSSNPKAAAIDKVTGEITCLKTGAVTITATANDGSGKRATFKLNLVKKVTSLELSQTSAILAGGRSLTLKVNAGDATNKTVTWSMTGDTAYMTLTQTGVLRAAAVTAPKTVVVTATANDGSGQKAQCTVKVYPATTAVQIWHEGALTKATTTLEVQEGETISLEGVSLPGNAANVYEWKSSLPTAASVDKDTGEVTGLIANRIVTITCTAMDGTARRITVKVKVVPAV